MKISITLIRTFFTISPIILVLDYDVVPLNPFDIYTLYIYGITRGLNLDSGSLYPAHFYQKENSLKINLQAFEL